MNEELVNSEQNVSLALCSSVSTIRDIISEAQETSKIVTLRFLKSSNNTLSAVFVQNFSLDLIRQYWLKTNFGRSQAGVQTPIRAQSSRLLAEIDGPTRRPLLPLTLMRYLLSWTAAFKGADGAGEEDLLRRAAGFQQNTQMWTKKKIWTFLNVCPQCNNNTDWNPRPHTHTHTPLCTPHHIQRRLFMSVSQQRTCFRSNTLQMRPVSASKRVRTPNPECEQSLLRESPVGCRFLAGLQTADALYTNESIHFYNRSPIWH